MRTAFAVVLLALLACTSGGKKTDPKKIEPSSKNELGDEMADRAQCEETVAHLRAVMPGSMNPDPEADITDCMTMPAPVAVCLAGAADPTAAQRCIDEYADRLRKASKDS